MGEGRIAGSAPARPIPRPARTPAVCGSARLWPSWPTGPGRDRRGRDPDRRVRAGRRPARPPGRRDLRRVAPRGDPGADQHPPPRLEDADPRPPVAINKPLVPWLKALYTVWGRVTPGAFRLAYTEPLLSGCSAAPPGRPGDGGGALAGDRRAAAGGRRGSPARGPFAAGRGAVRGDMTGRGAVGSFVSWIAWAKP
jgi:hypothetical protein